MPKELDELKEEYRKIGARRFWAIAAPLLVWAGLGVWLNNAATWPGQCDTSADGNLGLLQQLFCSPNLLSGGPLEIGLFVWLWSLPLLAVGAILWFVIRSRWNAPK